jgi:hypothetical protein
VELNNWGAQKKKSQDDGKMMGGNESFVIQAGILGYAMARGWCGEVVDLYYWKYA